MIDERFFEYVNLCCNGIRQNITLEANKRKGQVVMYDPAIRLYSINVIQEPNVLCVINFCPYCGAKLPEELSEKRIDVIATETGTKYWRGDNEEYYEFEKRLPEEFQSDEWWKKRGL